MVKLKTFRGFMRIRYVLFQFLETWLLLIPRIGPLPTTWHSVLGLVLTTKASPFCSGCYMTSRSFSWALQTFIRFLRGHHPQTIITDLVSGHGDAIAAQLPNTKHVICIWHVMFKLFSWFSQSLGLQYPQFKSEFELVCHLENIEDFENQWSHIVAQFGVDSDKHVALLYSYRASWDVAYVRGKCSCKCYISNKEMIPYLPIKTCLPLEEHA